MNRFYIMTIAILFTLAIYFLCKLFYQKFPKPFTIPILLGTTIIVILLFIFDISYDTYMIGGSWIEFFLGPAVVSLAFPLYKQRDILKKYFIPIVTSIFVSAIVGLTSGIYLAKWLQVEEELIYALIPKSVTTPVAMEITQSLGGAAPLAAVFVMVAGIGGAVFSPFIYKAFRIEHYLGKGIGLGSASHAIGTSKALESSEKEGAASSIAMTVSAIIVSIIAPLLVVLLL
ncbi:LrgB family protein [Evansella cellulosilytica]|uniref:LrgB family protein n=1 Tax=Evansella cellulosilytica (strain ATCC 21833 / DSM 2522 / FERM P-1141 / JCM 9156 / N-4) TaxID=649639 RepID=E6TQM4_EVAC2|nr:LrgB family protein [Evansella cellulosilytica]ADU30535.1 LrgB family protein [Evansella cellulosilytica DSM 2522]